VVLELQESNERYARDIKELHGTDQAHAAKLRAMEEKNKKLENMLTDCKSISRNGLFKSKKFVWPYTWKSPRSNNYNIFYATKKKMDVNGNEIDNEKLVKRLLLGTTGIDLFFFLITQS
jgi:hypothetical protein